jgi:hypothetical protein
MAAERTQVIGWIEIKPSPKGKDQIAITGHAQGLEKLTGRFTLAISRSAKGNKSSTSQGGQFDVAAGESRALSNTTINVGPNDRLVIELTLFVDGQPVFATTLRTADGPEGARKL